MIFGAKEHKRILLIKQHNFIRKLFIGLNWASVLFINECCNYVSVTLKFNFTNTKVSFVFANVSRLNNNKSLIFQLFSVLYKVLCDLKQAIHGQKDNTDTVTSYG